MVLFKLVPRNQYHKNGTQWIGKMFNALIGERRYESLRLLRRINYAKFWYTKQKYLYLFQQQYPHIAVWFSLLNKDDTSHGFGTRRPYERYQDFAVFNVNHEGWFQLYFFTAAVLVWLWNWYTIALHWPYKGETPEDQDLYRYGDSFRTTNFDRVKYKFNYYLMGTHFNAVTRRSLDDKDHPDNPRLNWQAQFNRRSPYGLDRYIKYYGYDSTMRSV